MVEKSIENIGEVKCVLAYKGYHPGRELMTCKALGFDTFVSPKESSSAKKNPDYKMEVFEYNQQNDT